MKHENSYGVIPVVKKKGEPYVLLVQLHAGHWGFPKGRKEEGETDKEAARRELLEETGLSIKKFFEHSPFTERYHFQLKGELILKTVHYYMAFVEGDLVIQKEEVKNAEWLPLQEAYHKMSFKEGKSLIDSLKKVFSPKPAH